jgi:hypothetical protein
MILATLRGDSFGQGAHALAAGENALVLFMLALHGSVLTLIAFVAWFAWYRRRRHRLPAETEALLEELDSPDPESSAAPAWERDPDWWKAHPPQDEAGPTG